MFFYITNKNNVFRKIYRFLNIFLKKTQSLSFRKKILLITLYSALLPMKCRDLKVTGCILQMHVNRRKDKLFTN